MLALHEPTLVQFLAACTTTLEALPGAIADLYLIWTRASSPPQRKMQPRMEDLILNPDLEWETSVNHLLSHTSLRNLCSDSQNQSWFQVNKALCAWSWALSHRQAYPEQCSLIFQPRPALGHTKPGKMWNRSFQVSSSVLNNFICLIEMSQFLNSLKVHFLDSWVPNS